MSRKCKNCKHWEGESDGYGGICYNKYMQVGEPMGDKSKKKSIRLSDEGADVGKDVDDMEKIIKKVTEALWLETDKNFGCIHWKGK